jgi:hypothetical protein
MLEEQALAHGHFLLDALSHCLHALKKPVCIAFVQAVFVN